MKINSIVYKDIKDSILEKEYYGFLANKVILVTGATGLIGSMFIKSILMANREYSLNIKVLALVRNKSKALNVFEQWLEEKDIEIIENNGFDINLDCDYIIHCAAITQSKLIVSQPVETLNTTINSTVSVLNMAMRTKARVLYLSSMEMYGVPYKESQLISENDYGIVDPLKVRSVYPEGKRVAESYCTAYHNQYGVDVCMARLAQTFGAGVDVSDNRVFMQFAKSVIKGTNIELHTKGESVANFCYLSDTIRGLLVLLAKGKSGEAYNICNDAESRKYIDIAKLVAEKVANGMIEVIINIPSSNEKLGYAPDVKMFLSSNKITELGWKPRITMEEAYRKLVYYLKEEGVK